VSRPALGSTQPPVQWVPGVLSPGVKRGRGVMLTPHPHLLPRSRMTPWRIAGLLYIYSINLNSISVLSSNLCLGCGNCLFPSDFPALIHYNFFLSPVSVTVLSCVPSGGLTSKVTKWNSFSLPVVL
jgi:hypothetical protein